MSQKILKRREITSGVSLNFVENDRYKTNYITFYFVSPLDKKRASYNTLLSRVLTRGTENFSSQLKLNRALDEAYDASLTSDAVKVGEWHALAISLSLLDNAYALHGEDITAKGLDLLEEVIFRPYLPDGKFSEEYVKGEMKMALLEIESLVNNKARYARQRMIECMCKKEPYSTCALGDKREIKKISADSLFSYYKELVRTARVEIFFVGRFDENMVEERVQKLFYGVERDFSPLPCTTTVKEAKAVTEITEEMDITQANLVMGFRTGVSIYDPAWRAMSLYNSVLGGSLTSKLFCVLREKMSLCYSISSFPDALKGIMTIYAGIGAENREVAIKEALHQMEEITLGNVTDEEMENARGAIVHALRGLEDNPGALADWFLPRILAGVFSTPDEIIRELSTLTVKDVMEVSKGITLDTIYTLQGKEER